MARHGTESTPLRWNVIMALDEALALIRKTTSNLLDDGSRKFFCDVAGYGCRRCFCREMEGR